MLNSIITRHCTTVRDLEGQAIPCKNLAVRWAHSNVQVGEWSLGQWIEGVVSFQERYGLYLLSIDTL